MKKNILTALLILFLFLLTILAYLGAFSSAKVQEKSVPALTFAGIAIEGLGNETYTQASLERAELLKKLAPFDIDSTRAQVNMHYSFSSPDSATAVKLIAGYRLNPEEITKVETDSSIQIVTLPSCTALVSEKTNRGMISLLFGLRKMHSAIQTLRTKRELSTTIPTVNIVETNKGETFTYYLPISLTEKDFTALWDAATPKLSDSTTTPEPAKEEEPPLKTIAEVQKDSISDSTYDATTGASE